MLIYLLEVTLCWAACLFLFHFLLRRETFFRTNRWYLLGTALLGLFIPVIELPGLFGAAEGSPVAYYFQPVTIGVEQLEAILITASAEGRSFDWWQLLTWAYFIGAATALARFLHGLRQIFRLYRQSEAMKVEGYRFVSTAADHVPFSFFKNLFWSKNFQVDAADRESIMRHEEAHIFQWHSLDVVLVELLGVIFWCCPPIYFLQKAIKTNHEYLADEAALQQSGRKNYGQLLLRQFRPSPQMALSNSLFSSQIKNRIVMMTKNKSSKLAGLKYLAGLPLLALLCYAFSFAEGEKTTPNLPDEIARAQVVRDTNPENRVYKEVDEVPRFPGCEEVTDADEQKTCWERKMLTFIFDEIKYPEEARKNEIEGMVVVKFIIEKDGSVSGGEIKRSIGGGCEEEVLRVVGRMPKWISGKQDGKPVRVEFNLPVKFKLDASAQSDKPKVGEMPTFIMGCEDQAAEAQEACGKKALFSFIGQNLEYPKTAKKQGVEGMVVASFTIEEDGALKKPTIEKSLDPACDAEVIRVLQAMPKWRPGMKDGKPVAVEMKLPFKFALSDEETSEGGVKNLASEIELFQVYPNPTSDKINVKFKTKAGAVTVRLMNMDGKELAKNRIEHDGEEQAVIFETSEFSRGTVFVSLTDSNGKSLETTNVVLQ